MQLATSWKTPHLTFHHFDFVASGTVRRQAYALAAHADTFYEGKASLCDSSANLHNRFGGSAQLLSGEADFFPQSKDAKACLAPKPKNGNKRKTDHSIACQLLTATQSQSKYWLARSCWSYSLPAIYFH